MSVLIVTSVGDIEVDLHTDKCPLTTKNFLKLCKMKYYNGCLFHKVEKDFLAQTGDPTGSGTGGDSIYKFLYGDQARFFDDEIRPELRHLKTGTVAMASAGENCNASQFYITLRDEVDYLDDKHTVFGMVAEGFDTLTKINEAYVDDKGRPFKDIRIKHTYVLDDPFDDPPQLAELIPDNSPTGKPRDEIAEERLEDSWVPLDETVAPEELEEMIRSKEAHTNAVILESLADIPDAEIKPPENVLFVCKLNPVTQMDNCLIDDRRIHVDFSQSVSKLWGQFRQSKRNAKKDGCFKCGAPDHLVRDCDQDGDQKNKGPNYVLKDENTQRGGNHRRSYDLVFDEDDAGYSDKEDHENSQRRKIQRNDDQRSELPPRGDRDRNNRERTHIDEKGSRRGKDDDRNRGGRKHDYYHSSSRFGDRSSGRYDDRDNSKRHSRSRSGEDEEDYRRRDRSDGERRHRDDGYEKSDRHRRDEVDHRKRSPESRRREDGGHRERNQHSDDRPHKERRHRDGR
ncbi:Peptidyl-prolyl cis-trans isomerase CYP59 [Dichanthelium oligosanthes]|uniref:Peptidyl-prolyl cis-trans isomerase n=1 Tax=Dichanthelium oligosanthes TaxID=888268 RepID=A0A1E5USC3_9POAL|nr:Peptidyl-prolyl cis-trans isomerase CYP59 [Dichanthelium oligosanthes]